MEIDGVTLDESNVETVCGQIAAHELGMTLTHEHLISDWTRRYQEPAGETERAVFHTKVDASMTWLLTENPGCCLDNGRQDDPEAAIGELANFSDAGGRTVIDCTNDDMGRDPIALKRISQRSGVNIVMGSGWYVHGYYSEAHVSASIEALHEQLLTEFRDGVAGTGLKPGIIGEVGVSPLFTTEERTHLAAAARAQRDLGVPLFVHLPGWQRRAFEVLNLLLDVEGVAPRAVVLCHMDPSGRDRAYQEAVAARGVWLEFDMIGMPVFYAGEGQSPSPDETAAAVAGLVRGGFAPQLLLSHDLALKSMWTLHGGNGLGYVPRLFLPRLERHGVPRDVAAGLMTTNPLHLFESARRVPAG